MGEVDSTSTVTIGIAWSTHFKRRQHHLRAPRRLEWAYRSPSFFLEEMMASNGSSIGNAAFLMQDEAWKLGDFNGSAAAKQDSVDILYVCTHGKDDHGTYRTVLHDAEWEPFVSGIGNGTGPWIAVFDTCDLIKLTDPRLTKPAQWQAGPSLRLLLGFASLATVDKGPSRRGRAFAANLLAGMPVAGAWLQAVHSTGFPDLDLAIAIALGDDPDDARKVMRTATLASGRPPPRNSVTASIEWRTCH